MKTRNIIGLGIWILAFSATAAHAATYYVATTGNNSNPGTQAQPWRTIQYAAGRTAAGDTVRVQAGSYTEAVTVTTNGTLNNPITFVADGSVTITGQFMLESSNYIRIIGFNFDGRGSVRRLIFLHDTRGVEIWNNTLRGHTGVAIETYWSGSESPHTTSDQTLLVGNRIIGINDPSGNGDAFSTWGDDNVFAYNEINRTGTDYFLFYGNRNRFINNYGHGPTENSDLHIDFLQTGANCCGRVGGTDFTFVEGNYYVGGLGGHQHTYNLETAGDFSGNFLSRRNVWHYTGGGGFYNYHHVYVVNETWSEMQVSDPSGYLGFHASRDGNHRVFNNIFTEAWGSAATSPTVFELNSPYVTGYNLVWDWQSGGSLNWAGIIRNETTRLAANPLYVSHNVHPTATGIDHSGDDFHIQSNSPAKDSGGAVTTVTSGSGLSITVGDGGFFRGFEPNLPQYGGNLAVGDLVTIGSQIRRINSISGNVLTLNSPVTASAGTPVYMGDDATPDRGALPYKPTYNITNSLSYDNGTLTASVNDPSIVRHIEFYVDGLPVAVDIEAPYTFDMSGYAQGSSHQVKAIARPLYASKILAYESAMNITVGPSIPTPATITADPQPQTVFEGQAATFTVVVAGHPTPSRQWQRNNGDGWNNISGATGLSYTTPSLLLSDNQSQYRCEVSNNPQGIGLVTVHSNPATLTVNPNPPTFTIQPQTQSVVINTNITLTVAATGSGTLSYQWEMNGNSMSGETATTLTPNTVAVGINIYRCRVSNNFSQSTLSDAATVTVTLQAVPPTIRTQPLSQTINAGQSATFTVEADGTTPLSYQWRRYGADIDGATSASYTIPVTTINDNGAVYSCVVNNVANSPVTSNGATLTVLSSGVGTPAANSGLNFLPFKNIFNPNRETLTIRYTSDPSEVSLMIYDRHGSEIRTLQGAGGQAVWDGRNKSGSIVAAGTYTLILKSTGGNQTKKVVVVK